MASIHLSPWAVPVSESARRASGHYTMIGGWGLGVRDSGFGIRKPWVICFKCGQWRLIRRKRQGISAHGVCRGRACPTPVGPAQEQGTASRPPTGRIVIDGLEGRPCSLSANLHRSTSRLLNSSTSQLCLTIWPGGPRPSPDARAGMSLRCGRTSKRVGEFGIPPAIAPARACPSKQFSSPDSVTPERAQSILP